ncbi:SCO1860 family LAETG-anchored protein [Streptomyces sp. RFCAC02]|uniref:SCO1860 family LAETG-anchored protein n=1 Tax=Streptomyces sp. RFCAC02 TaxID=2499143 RepID=UPI00102094E9|nr:SCO1860 family LAETG-anchored protein [Streptomyces sp. RFCAC02]
MYNSAIRRPVAVAIATAAAFLGAGAPVATADDGTEPAGGTASAAVLRTGLNVSLLNRAIELPLNVVLNEVSAPDAGGTADETLLTARLDGVAGDQPFEVLSAEVASATATSDEQDGAAADVSLTNASVHLPGLPGLSLVELGVVEASAVCRPGEAPVADTTMPATVTVLGQEVELAATGSVDVDVPGVGEVTLDLSRTETNDTDASAAALDLSVEVDPLDLGVAEVTGRVTLAEASCTAPAGGGDSGASGGSGGEEEPEPGDDTSEEPPADTGGSAGGEDTEGTRPQGGRDESGADLAETGGGSATPLVVGGAAVLLAAGTATVLITRRRRTTA